MGWLVLAYFILYTLPRIVLDLLQLKYVKLKSSSKPIILEADDYNLAARYAISKQKYSVAENIINFIVFALWIFYGLNALEYLLNTFHLNMLLSAWLLVMIFFIINAIIGLPMSILEIKRDKLFGFSNITSHIFLKDTVRSAVLFLVIGGIIVILLLLLMKYFELWWLLGFVVLFIIALVANLIYPTLIAPMFNKFTPLEDEGLKDKIQNLMDKVGFKSSGIYVIDASKRDGRLNAYFGGLGKSKRVVLFDTLLSKISTEGIIAILGHELGHFKHKDILKNIALMACMLFILFAIAGNLIYPLQKHLGLVMDDGIFLSLLVLLIPVLTFLFMPIVSYFSRKAEYSADEFGASFSSKRSLYQALIRLVNENKSFPYSHPAFIFFYYSHPPLVERLKALEED
ncbi:M48 family metallopeptidase [Helicobacter sp. 11S02629-2]|uniref:M48 family metallopeptidase n=1 Tax=Helicobacter sp. 11S02629-2 TaxID=1476195 RepID=UPI000BA5CF94|nr:M48 family metallopeptidase [Helicobacter sp. 11S02629-2]PAF44593.1 peptidase M48 [Helicobacter sp. 11S02629-2]